MRVVRIAFVFGFFLSALAVTAKASTARVILEYHYGNETVGSDLTIHEDGAIEHAERTATQTTPVSETNLTSDAKTRLLAAIQAAANGKQQDIQGQPTASGSPFGYLIAFPSVGSRVLIRLIERGSSIGAPDKVTYDDAPEAQTVLDLAKSYVTNKMY